MMRKVACYMVLLLAFVGTMRAEEVGQEWAAPVRTSALVAIEGLENDTTQREQIGLFWQDDRLCVQRYNAPNAVLATAQVAGDTLFVVEHQLYAVNKAANYMYSVDLAPRDFMAVKLNGESVFPVMNWDSENVYNIHSVMDLPMNDYILGHWQKILKPKRSYVSGHPENILYELSDRDHRDTTYVLWVYGDNTWQYYVRDTLQDCGRFDVYAVNYPLYRCYDCHRNEVYGADTIRLQNMYDSCERYTIGAVKNRVFIGEVSLNSTTDKLPLMDRRFAFMQRNLEEELHAKWKIVLIPYSVSAWQSAYPFEKMESLRRTYKRFGIHLEEINDCE